MTRRIPVQLGRKINPRFGAPVSRGLGLMVVNVPERTGAHATKADELLTHYGGGSRMPRAGLDSVRARFDLYGPAGTRRAFDEYEQPFPGRDPFDRVEWADTPSWPLIAYGVAATGATSLMGPPSVPAVSPGPVRHAGPPRPIHPGRRARSRTRLDGFCCLAGSPAAAGVVNQGIVSGPFLAPHGAVQPNLRATAYPGMPVLPPPPMAVRPLPPTAPPLPPATYYPTYAPTAYYGPTPGAVDELEPLPASVATPGQQLSLPAQDAQGAPLTTPQTIALPSGADVLGTTRVDPSIPPPPAPKKSRAGLVLAGLAGLALLGAAKKRRR